MITLESKYKEYIDLKSKITDLETELKRIGEYLKQDILDNGGELVETKFGSFFITRRTKWQYTEAVKSLEDDVKSMKKKEESDGTAIELDETVSLTFRAKKL